MADKRESGRVKDLQQKRVLDDAARRRRQRKALEALESDNFQDDPHADLKMSKKAPKFEESMDTGQPVSKKKRKSKSDHFKFKYKKSFSALLEEEHMTNRDTPNYLSASVPQSRFPERRFCAVCGFPSNYTCVQCGARYCSVKCLGTHQDTRCLKWTA
ncbi:zinc finger HIT domain-containing protein 1-like [Pecten maximus]|uniref:zinc finger HIT domain-containing protein 1-like n=1 Tax=Pecten maximus TaxID=6579 RepID=UPI001458DB87|nr:zinc finger HIT domain-containing protein 1-like [Pecten maximus]